MTDQPDRHRPESSPPESPDAPEPPESPESEGIPPVSQTSPEAASQDSPSAPRVLRRGDQEQAQRTAAFVVEAARHLVAMHCTDVIIFDVRGMSDVTDYIIIGSGTSERQIRSVSRELAKVARPYQLERFGSEADQGANWVVTDFVEVVVHLFEPAARAHYDLEMMWGDAPRIDYNEKK